MPESLDDVTTGAGALIFPDSLEGTRFVLEANEVYSAEEVRKQLGEDYPEYGRWLPVKVTNGDDRVNWMAAPSELIQELQTIGPTSGSTMEVTKCEKVNGKENAPYRVNVALRSQK